MSSSSGPTGEFSNTNWRTLSRFAAAPAVFILTIVIREVVLNPAAAFIGYFDRVASIAIESIEMIVPILVGEDGPLRQAAISLLVIPQTINTAVSNSIAGFGLGAPVAFALGFLIQSVLLFIVVFGLYAVLVSAIPGASGITNTAGSLWNRLT